MIPEALLTKLTTTAKPLIDILIKDIIAPKIKKFTEKCELKYKEYLIPIGEHFEEYLYRSFKKYSIINTLVFKNEQRLLKDLFIPLTLIKDDHQKRPAEQTKIDKYPVDLVKAYNKVLITDTAGMGKSTLTKRLFLDVIENGYGIPIYIEMRRLKRNRSILQEINEQINSISKDFDTRLLLEFIQTGEFIFFLDGYDEISLEERSAVTTNVQDFISKAGNNTFIMTSRPELALSSFGDFQVFTINPLTKKEAYELLRKYDNQGSTSKQLIDELKSGQYEMINEFLKNPLLVSLLFAAFDYKQTIPLKKHIFYRQVYDAYFDSHDLSKGDSYIHDKCSKLDIDDFERILRYVGFKCLKSQKIEYEKDSLLQIIDEAKDFYPDLSFSSSDFFTDIITAVPLFCKDGQFYKWVHKSLQEYFAAQFIYKDSKKNQDAILSALYNSDNIDKYINLLDLYYDIDNWGFKKNVIYPLCESYINFYDINSFKSDIIPNNDIENRIGLLFLRETCMIKVDFQDDSDLFIEIENRTKNHMEHRISYVTRFHETNVCTSNCFLPKRKIFPLLGKRLPNLFRSYNPIILKSDFMLAENEVFKVNVHTGEDDKNKYVFFNYYLQGGPSEYRYILDYNACKIELETINKIIKKKEESSSLVDGL